MIHSALLIAKRGDYTNFHLEKRKEIFWTLFLFFKRIKIKIKTVLINKKYLLELTKKTDDKNKYLLVLNDSEHTTREVSLYIAKNILEQL